MHAEDLTNDVLLCTREFSNSFHVIGARFYLQTKNFVYFDGYRNFVFRLIT